MGTPVHPGHAGHCLTATATAQLSDTDGSATADLRPVGAGDLRGERHNVPLPIASTARPLNSSRAHSCSVGTWVLGLSRCWEMLGKDVVLHHPL